jgi:hypothetical protein
VQLAVVENSQPPRELVSVLRGLNNSVGFPPRVPMDDSALLAWLEQDEALIRFAAVDKAGLPRGYVQVTAPHSYALPSLQPYSAEGSFLEVGKLFLDTTCQQSGMGFRLLDVACKWIVRKKSIPMLVVVDAWKAAARLYRRYGFIDIGHFDGKDGKNTVMIFRGFRDA